MTPGERPSALTALEAIERQLTDRRPAVFLDYDGTLTPIVQRPDLAVLSADMRRTVRRLADRCAVAIISGRDRQNVRQLVGLDGVVYAGSHGFDISGPDGLRLQHPGGVERQDALERAREELQRALRPIPGALVEPKAFAVAVHYREVADADVPTVRAAVEGVAARHAGLRVTGGKKVHELRPAIDWDKGRAVQWLLDALGLDGSDVLPLYLGDDETDEDAFRALEDRGIGIRVGEPDAATAARYALRDPGEVQTFLNRLADTRRASPQ